MTDEVQNEAVEESLPSDENQDVNSSESSTEEGVDNDAPKTALDAALAALGQDKTEEAQEESDTDSGVEESETSEASTEATAADERTEEEKDADLPFHKHPRWQEVYKERNELRQKLADYEPATQKATAWDNMQKFVADSGLNDQDMDAGFEIMVAMKHDPAKAYGMLKPYMDTLAQMVGEAVPQDLQDMVDSGRLDEEAAKKFAAERSNRLWAEQRRAEDAQRFQAYQQGQTQQQQAANIGAIQDAVTAWESQWKSSDPDFSKKHAAVRDRTIALVQAQGQPQSVEAAVALAKQAKDEVENQIAQWAPKREAKKVVTGGSVNSSGATPRPKSALEAAKLALKR